MELSDNLIILNFRVVAEEPGTHLVICQEYPFLLERGNGMEDCMKRIQEKVETMLKANKEIFLNKSFHTDYQENEQWEFRMTVDFNSCEIKNIEY